MRPPHHLLPSRPPPPPQNPDILILPRTWSLSPAVFANATCTGKPFVGADGCAFFAAAPGDGGSLLAVLPTERPAEEPGGNPTVVTGVCYTPRLWDTCGPSAGAEKCSFPWGGSNLCRSVPTCGAAEAPLDYGCGAGADSCCVKAGGPTFTEDEATACSLNIGARHGLASLNEVS